MVPVLDPARVTRAAWHAAAWDVDTDRLIQGFAREIRAAGRVVTGAKAEAIWRIDGGWEVETRDASYTARMLVNAAGAWADDIARLADIAPIGLTPKRRSMARVAAPEGHDPQGLADDHRRGGELVHEARRRRAADLARRCRAVRTA